MADTGIHLARSLGLHYASDEEPGCTRRRHGRGFSYRGVDGRPVDPEVRARLQALAVPPAWTDVWYSPDPDAHLLATGRDGRGRKQYRYHPLWREASDQVKFDALGDFAARLPGLRRHVDADLRRPGLSAERVLALVVRLLDETLIRVGNAEYARDNGSFGLTTLRSEHVRVSGTRITFSFQAKGGAEHEAQVADRRLAELVRRCDDLDGYELFAYVDDDGTVVDVDSTDVNAYLADVSGRSFGAKVFRTWGGTVAAVEALAACACHSSNNGLAAEHELRACEAAAELLGNTREVARSAYVHPTVLEVHRTGDLGRAWKRARPGRWLDRAESATRSILRTAGA